MVIVETMDAGSTIVGSIKEKICEPVCCSECRPVLCFRHGIRISALDKNVNNIEI